MKRCVVLAVLVLCVAALPAAAQKTTKAAIVVEVPELGCSTAQGSNTISVQSWAWGATNDVDLSGGSGSGGAGAGKTSLSTLNVVKGFDECSPRLFRGVVAGVHFPSVTLTHTTGKDADMAIKLENVIISSYTLGGAESASPTESVAFTFSRICVRQSFGNQVCWDAASGKLF